MTDPQPNEPNVTPNGFRPEDHFVIRDKEPSSEGRHPERSAVQTNEGRHPEWSEAESKNLHSFQPPAMQQEDQEVILREAKDLGEAYRSDTFSHLPAAENRQPNLGYSAALLLIGVIVLFAVSVGIGLVSVATHTKLSTTSASMPRASILMEAITFLVTYAIAFFVFPRFWKRPFGQVIEWNASVVRHHSNRLVATGIALSVVAQALESLLTLPKEMPVDAFFKQPSTLWIIAIFGTFVAPVCEEIFFRGFLLRGFAIFFDWLALPKTPEAQWQWQTSDQLTQRSMILSGILTSGLFAAMHAAQLGWAWNAVGVLWIVGGGLTYIRIRYNSVAASSVVHASYNGLLFVIMFVITGGFRHLDKLANH